MEEKTNNTRDWYAWLNKMPPKPDDLHVTGEVLVANPGITAQLSARAPQGTNPNILMLDLNLVQQPGEWIQVLSWVEARYDKIIGPEGLRYEQVNVLLRDEVIARLEIDEVH